MGVEHYHHFPHYLQTKNRALHEASIFKAPLTPFINYVILVFFAFLLIVMFISEATRTALLLTPIWFIALFIIYKMKKMTSD